MKSDPRDWWQGFVVYEGGCNGIVSASVHAYTNPKNTKIKDRNKEQGESLIQSMVTKPYVRCLRGPAKILKEVRHGCRDSGGGGLTS